MVSPAWNFRNRVRQREARENAKKLLEKQEQETIKKMAEENSDFQLLLDAIDTECKNISKLPKGKERTERKIELINTYLPVIETYINSDDEYENRALTQVMIWLFDVGHIDTALKVAAIAIEQNQPMPKRFKSNVKTFVADAFLEWCESKLAVNEKVEPYFSAMLNDVLSWKIHDEIKLKYLRTAAKLADESGDIDKALEYCDKAEKIDPVKAKVKTLKKKLEKAAALRDEEAAAENAKPKQ